MERSLRKEIAREKMLVTQTKTAVTLVPHCFSVVLLALNALKYQEIPNDLKKKTDHPR